METIEESFRIYGFDPIVTPTVEYWDLLKGKYGEEAENKEIWRFQVPQSDKWYALKYDQTVPLVRYFVKHRPKLPFKRYVIDKTYRYDNPQRGRYREFWQADADIVGSPNPEADAEILNLMRYIYNKLGFTDAKIRLNDRRALEKVVELSGAKDKFREVTRIIDKWDKIGEDGVYSELSNLVGEKTAEKIVNLLKSDKIEEFYPESFWKIYDLLESKRGFEIDLKLARGFDYYTGMIYEVWIDEFNRSLGGGGRYDDLIKKIAGIDVPAVGGSIGVDPVIDVGIDLGIFNLSKKSYTEIAVIYIGNTFESAWRICNDLRYHGFRVYIDLLRRNFKKQIDYVSERGIRYLVIVGEKDLQNGEVTVQDRESKERINVKIGELADYLEKILRRR